MCLILVIEHVSKMHFILSHHDFFPQMRLEEHVLHHWLSALYRALINGFVEGWSTSARLEFIFAGENDGARSY